ncbi:MAG: electron transfer flavoprotein subunit beta/FixA family protein [Phycisphaerales bacterium]|nr:electron transfer flavoprotein subunit beta/FixA family protein [Phycisphaerales bacterium]
MRVLVIARTVPDSRATIRVNASGGAIETTGVAMICDPFDELGVEQGVRLREGRPDVTEAVVMSAGPGPATPQDQALRAALAMGIDRGIYVHGDLVTPPARYDELLLARVLAAAIKAEEAKNGEFALILCGKAAIDTDAGELGPALGELLNRPSIGAATKIEIGADAKSLKATRRGDGVSEAIEASLPAVVSCEKGLAEPRFASLPNIMKAKKKPVEMVSAADLPGLAGIKATTKVVKLSPPAPRAPCKMLAGEPAQMASELVRLLRSEAKVI